MVLSKFQAVRVGTVVVVLSRIIKRRGGLAELKPLLVLTTYITEVVDLIFSV